MDGGIILVNSDLGKQFGFTSYKFNGWLWKKGNEIYISFIESRHPGRGHLKTLFDKIVSDGYDIVVPTPFPRMEMICEKYGMAKEVRNDSDVFGPVECMIYKNTTNGN